MSYFTKINSLAELKSQYRALAFKHHPDMGGNLADMQAVNAEYDMLYQVWNTSKASSEGYENAAQSRNAFYEQEGWKGKNYNSDLYVKDIAQLFRAYTKKHWPQCRFSVTSTHSSISVCLVSAPFSAWADLTTDEAKREIERKRLEYHYYDPETTIKSGQMSVSHYNRHIEECLLLSPVAKVLFRDIAAFLQSYNFDYSDSQTDYFHTNFYLDLAVGKWNKPFTQKGKMDMAESTELTEQKCAA